MKKIVGICNTPLILLTFINLMEQIKDENTIVDVILTDESVGMKKNAERLVQVSLFRNVYFISIKKRYKGGSILKKIRKTFYIFDRNDKTLSNITKNQKYDSFFYCLNDIISNQLYYFLKSNNEDLRSFKFEEGYTDYVSNKKDGIIKSFLLAASIFHNKGILERDINGYYVYHPEWIIDSYYSKQIIKRMMPINTKNKPLIKMLNYTFGYTNQGSEFKVPYVFLEESFFTDNVKISDSELIEKVINTVGKSNIIIKPHPRNSTNRFEKLGVQVSSCRIPWEIIMLNEDFSQTVFVSISSGSIVNSLGWEINTGKKNVLLYKLLDKRPSLCNSLYDDLIDKNIELLKDNRLITPETEKELVDTLMLDQ